MYTNSLVRNAIRSKPALIALVIIFAYYTWSIFEGLLQYASHQILYLSLSYKFLPYNPITINPIDSLLPPSLHHPFGTNYNGEDILSRILYAAPSDAEISTVVVISAIIIGGLVGMFAGYFGGWIDEILMRITDVFLAVPGLILVIAIAVLLGSSFTSAMIGLMVPWWATYARLFRSQTLVVKSMGYVDASKLMGFSNFKIVISHVFHNVIDPVLSYAALDFGNVILTYASLTFLGIGLQGLNQPEWGAMVSNGIQYLPQAWWYPLFPSIVILIIVASFVILGDRLQDVIAGRVVY
ncbi:ABC transporter permease subunit [Acidianus sulfidivorans JP7]|uniref:ABC transporter permease n=1 Tax=Acidianus sulfidivorans JP7 TaxID=619593 RepID=A0A2U9IQA5_9CREN|nr:ABC transporter permease subunit [Acidianus sulfidivorans JP7]